MTPTSETSATRVEVRVAASFKRDLRSLKKSYPNIQADIQPTLSDIEAGKTPGDQIPGVDYTVYKVRLPNRDSKRGKRGGYRVIYYINAPVRVLLVAIYSKSERSDISPKEIKELIRKVMEQLELENT